MTASPLDLISAIKDSFIEKWGAFVSLSDSTVICTSAHAKRRWSTALELDASKLSPPLKVTYDTEKPKNKQK